METVSVSINVTKRIDNIIKYNNMELNIVNTEHGIIINLPNESWILCTEYPNNYDFNQLWELHPEHYDDVIVFGKKHKMPRYTQSYGKSYTFSNVNHTGIEIPNIMNDFI